MRSFFNVLFSIIMLITVVLVLLNVRVPDGPDKVFHVLTFLSLTCLLLQGAGRWVKPSWCGVVHLLICLGIIGFGGLTEWLQQFLPHRTADWSDWLADSFGVLMGLLVYRVMYAPRERFCAGDCETHSASIVTTCNTQNKA